MLDPFHAAERRRAPDPGGLISLLVSVGVHCVCAAVFITIAFLARLHLPVPTPPREEPPMDLVLAEPIEPPPGSTDADALAGGKAGAAAEAELPKSDEAPPPPKPALPEAAVAGGTTDPGKSSLKQELDVPKVDHVFAIKGPDGVGASDRVAASAVAWPSASITTSGAPNAASASAASSSSTGTDTGTGDGTSDQGDGGHARTAPSLAARFTKELAPYAAHVPAWETLPLGQTDSVDITLELDAEGHVVRDRDPVAGITGAPESIVESVRRTQKSLLLVFSLPDHPVGAGTVTLRLRANVSAQPPPSPSASLDPNGIEYAFTFEGKSGTATFTLASGRHVELTVEVVRVEPK